MENIILCSECQGLGHLPRTRRKGKKKSNKIRLSAYPRKLYPYLKEDWEQLKEQLKINKKVEWEICFKCGGLGTISI